MPVLNCHLAYTTVAAALYPHYIKDVSSLQAKGICTVAAGAASESRWPTNHDGA